MSTWVQSRALALSSLTRRFTSAVEGRDLQTAAIVVTLDRPTTGGLVTWDAATEIEVTIIVAVDGVEYRCVGRASGGIRRGRGGVGELAAYSLRYTLPWGFFGARNGTPKRLGETRVGTFTGHVDVRWVGGLPLVTTLRVEAEEAAAPNLRFHSSVAFDAATDVLESGGDGVVSLSHTAGGSNRAAFAGMGVATDTAAGSCSITYAGSGMTLLWEDGPNGQQKACAAYRAGIASGASTVTGTLTGAQDLLDHFLGVISMTGVHQTTPVGTHAASTGSTSPASQTVGSVGNDDLVLDNIAYFNNATMTIGADQTQRNFEAPFYQFRQSTQLGSAGGVMSWTFANANWAQVAVAFKPSVAGFTLTAESGTFAITGTAASLRASRRIAAESGSFAITGTAATLRAGRRVAAESGAFALTGTAADLRASRRLDAGSGSFAISGTAANLLASRKLTAESGAYALTGTAAALRADRKIAAAAGAFVITGTDATLTHTTGYTLTAESGSFAISGTAATLRAGRRLDAGAGSFLLTGTAAGLLAGRRLSAASGSFTLTGTDAALRAQRLIAALSGAYGVTGTAAALRAARRLEALSGAYIISGTAATLTAGLIATIDLLALIDEELRAAGATSEVLRGAGASAELLRLAQVTDEDLRPF